MVRRLTCLIAFALLSGGATRAWAQEAPPAKTATAEPLYTMDLKGTSLRDALKILFANAKVDYSLAEDVPDAKVTLVAKDQPMDRVLQMLLREGSHSGKRITYTRDAGAYMIRLVPEPTAPVLTDMLHLVNTRPEDVLLQLQSFTTDTEIVAAKNSPDLIFRGTAERIQAIRETARLLDVAPRGIILKAEVVMVTDNDTDAAMKKAAKGNSQGTLLATILRTVSGKSAEGEDKTTGAPSKTARLLLHAEPAYLGDNTFEIATRWEISLPLSTGKTADGKGESLVRLEKHLSNTVRVRSGETTVVGGIILSQYGLKGEILFFLTATEIQNTSKIPNTQEKP